MGVGAGMSTVRNVATALDRRPAAAARAAATRATEVETPNAAARSVPTAR